METKAKALTDGMESDGYRSGASLDDCKQVNVQERPLMSLSRRVTPLQEGYLLNRSALRRKKPLKSFSRLKPSVAYLLPAGR